MQIWMVLRHGSRNPSAEVISTMKNVLPLIKKQILEAHKNGKGRAD